VASLFAPQSWWKQMGWNYKEYCWKNR